MVSGEELDHKVFGLGFCPIESSRFSNEVRKHIIADVFVQVFCHLAYSILNGHVSSISIDFVGCVNRISMVRSYFRELMSKRERS